MLKTDACKTAKQEGVKKVMKKKKKKRKKKKKEKKEKKKKTKSFSCVTEVGVYRYFIEHLKLCMKYFRSYYF